MKIVIETIKPDENLVDPAYTPPKHEGGIGEDVEDE